MIMPVLFFGAELASHIQRWVNNQHGRRLCINEIANGIEKNLGLAHLSRSHHHRAANQRVGQAFHGLALVRQTVAPELASFSGRAAAR